MKILKFTLTLLVVFVFASQGMAQNKKMMAKGEEKAAEINKEITSVNPELALSADQIKMIAEIQAEKLMAVKAIKKEGLSKEDEKAKIKELNKEAGNKITQEVLTQEQRKAKRKVKKSSDE